MATFTPSDEARLFRVAAVEHVAAPHPGLGIAGAIYAFEVRTFKVYAHAHAYAAALRRRGETVIIQRATATWETIPLEEPAR